MTVSSPLLPSPRDLRELWPHFHPWHPQTFWLGYLTLHRIEALVGVQTRKEVDPLAREVLDTLRLHGATTLDDIQHEIGWPTSLVRNLLKNLADRTLVEITESGHWDVTQIGVQATAKGIYDELRHERRVFHFAEGLQEGLPAFVRWESTKSQLTTAAKATWHFTADMLEAWIQTSEERKTAHGFPIEIKQVVSLTGELTPNDWNRIILHHQLFVPLIILQGQRTLGFTANQTNWGLQSGAPLFHFGSLSEACAFLGIELTVPPRAAWAVAWDMARRPMGLPQGEMQDYTITAQGPQVSVHLPTPSGNRKPAHGNVEPWLLAGSGPFWCAARVAILSDTS